VFQRVEQVAQHPVVGLDLFAFLPAGNQSGAFVQGGVYQMHNAGQARGKLLAGGGVGQVQWQEAHAPSRDSDDLEIVCK
jgi:hypothetical protein